MDVPVDNHVWKYYAGTLSKAYDKVSQRNAEIKDHFVDDTEWLFQ